MTQSHPRSTFLLKTLVPALLVAVGIGGLYAMYSHSAKAHIERPPERPPLVETVAVLAHEGGIELQVDGVVTPYREIELSAEVAGRIVSKSEDCRAGRFVTKGTLLLEIDPRDYELELQRLAELLKQAESNLAECDVESANTNKLIDLTREEHELQKKDLARMQRLAGAISEAEIDKAKRSEWNSRHSLLTLENQSQLSASRRNGLENARELIRTQIKKAELDLQRTKVVSPTDGVLVSDPVAQDSFVQKGDLLAVVEDTTKVEVRCNLKMDDLSWLWRQATGSGHSSPQYEFPRTPVTVVFRLHGSSTRFMWKGNLARFDGSGLDEKTRTVPSRVVVDDPRTVTVDGNIDAIGPRTLVRGMYVSVAIHANPRASFLRIPEPAVQPGRRILRVRDSKIDIIGPLHLVHLVEMRKGNGELGKYWIVFPLETDLVAGDRVIASPLPTAHAGMEIRERAGP